MEVVSLAHWVSCVRGEHRVFLARPPGSGRVCWVNHTLRQTAAVDAVYILWNRSTGRALVVDDAHDNEGGSHSGAAVPQSDRPADRYGARHGELGSLAGSTTAAAAAAAKVERVLEQEAGRVVIVAMGHTEDGVDVYFMPVGLLGERAAQVGFELPPACAIHPLGARLRVEPCWLFESESYLYIRASPYERDFCTGATEAEALRPDLCPGLPALRSRCSCAVPGSREHMHFAKPTHPVQLQHPSPWLARRFLEATVGDFCVYAIPSEQVVIDPGFTQPWSELTGSLHRFVMQGGCFERGGAFRRHVGGRNAPEELVAAVPKFGWDYRTQSIPLEPLDVGQETQTFIRVQATHCPAPGKPVLVLVRELHPGFEVERIDLDGVRVPVPTYEGGVSLANGMLLCVRISVVIVLKSRDSGDSAAAALTPVACSAPYNLLHNHPAYATHGFQWREGCSLPARVELLQLAPDLDARMFFSTAIDACTQLVTGPLREPVLLQDLPISMGVTSQHLDRVGRGVCKGSVEDPGMCPAWLDLTFPLQITELRDPGARQMPLLHESEDHYARHVVTSMEGMARAIRFYQRQYPESQLWLNL
jgi:hypothetical protein